MLDGEFLGGDDALSLVANIQKDFVVVDLDYSSFDDIPVIEVLDGLVNSCDDFIFAADVVNCDLRDRRGSGRVIGHEVGDSVTDLISSWTKTM